MGPDRLTTAPLFTPATFECIAEGNPQPTYQWLQRLPTPSDVIVERGRESKLHIANVTYDYQGEYVCKVTNVISGIERTVQSEAIALQVVGEGPATCFMSMINITVCVSEYAMATERVIVPGRDYKGLSRGTLHHKHIFFSLQCLLSDASTVLVYFRGCLFIKLGD